MLFFHHVLYLKRLKSGETVIRHIYNTHFEEVEQVAGLKEKWLSLHGKIDAECFARVLGDWMSNWSMPRNGGM